VVGDWLDALVFVGASRYEPGVEVIIESVLDRSRDTDLICVASVPPDRDLGRANRRVFDKCLHSGGRARALARIDPLEPGSVQEARELVRLGCIGLFLDPWRDSYSISNCAALDAVVEVAEEHGIPVTVESGFPWVSEPLQVANFAASHPTIPIVATRGLQMNMSGLSLEAASIALERCPNLYLLSSGVYRQDWLEALVTTGFADRLLYASMAPDFHPELERARVEMLSSASERVAVANAKRVYGWD